MRVTRNIFGFLITAASGAYGTHLLIGDYGMRLVSEWLKYLVPLYAVLLVPTMQLILKLNDLADKNKMGHEVHARLYEIVRQKLSRLWALMGLFVVGAVAALLSSLLANHDGRLAESISIFAGTGLVLALYFTAYLPFEFHQMSRFQWRLGQEQVAEEARKRMLEQMTKDAVGGFRDDEHLRSHNREL